MEKSNNITKNHDNILDEDLRIIVDDKKIFREYQNSTIFVTGATGLIGSQIVKALLLSNQINNSNITVMILARSKEKVVDVFGQAYTDPMLKIIYADIMELYTIQDDIDYIIHGASITSSQEFVSTPVETIKTAVVGSMNILELAKEKKVKGMVYLSSLEVYGVTDFAKEDIKEEDSGYLNPLSVRSSYSEGKRMVECTCVSYATEYKLPIKIARLAQTFGAGVDYEDKRVFAQFARCVIEKKDILLHTKGDTVRNYCYSRDAVKAILYILAYGEDAQAYNVANEETDISIRDMAQLLCDKYAESKIKLIFDIAEEDKYGYNPTIKIKLNTRKLCDLGWTPEVDLITMYDRTIQSMRNRRCV